MNQTRLHYEEHSRILLRKKNGDLAACMKKIQELYLLTEYMVLVLAPYVCDRQWLKAKLAVVPFYLPTYNINHFKLT